MEYKAENVSNRSNGDSGNWRSHFGSGIDSDVNSLYCERLILFKRKAELRSFIDFDITEGALGRWIVDIVIIDEK